MKHRYNTLGLLLLIALHDPASAITLYKWVDEDGHVSYQDSLPSRGQPFEEQNIKEPIPTAVTRDVTGNPLPVVLYFSSECPKCDQVRGILQSNNIPFIQHLTDYNSAVQQEILRISSSTEVPVLTIGEEVIADLDRSQLENTLRASGYSALVNPD